MPRVVKAPHVRRSELLDLALRYSVEIGFDSFSIDQLTRESGVAKGTFYHYFTSKQDLLEQMVRRFADELFEALEEAQAGASTEPPTESASGAGPSSDAAQRFHRLLLDAAAWKSARLESSLAWVPLLFRAENAELRRTLLTEWRDRTRDLFEPIVEQGQVDGSFHVDDPHATTGLILTLWFDGSLGLLGEGLELPDAATFAARMQRGSQALLTAVERILGAPAGSFDIGDQTAAYLAFHTTLASARSSWRTP